MTDFDSEDLRAIERELTMAVKLLDGAKRGVLAIGLDDLARYDDLVRHTLTVLHHYNKLKKA